MSKEAAPSFLASEGPPHGVEPDELAAVAVEVGRAAEQLVVLADALVTAPPEARPALRERLYRWQRVLALGARRLAHAAPDR